MSQVQSSSRKTWGFLAFALGCMIAISGAAKLHSKDRTMRTRGLLVRVAKGKVAKAAGASVATAQSTLLAARLNDLTTVQVKALLQSSYLTMQRQTAKALKITEPAATMGVLKTNVVVAMVKKWVAKPPAAGRSKKMDFQRDVVAAVVRTIGASPKKAKKGAKGKTKAKSTPKAALPVPRAVKEIVAVLRDKTVNRLAPYLVWYALRKQSAAKVTALAHNMSTAYIMDLARSSLKGKPAEGVQEFVTGLAKGLGKKLKLKSKDHTVVLPATTRHQWFKALKPKMSNVAALQKAREVVFAGASAIGSRYSIHLAKSLADEMRLEWTDVTTTATAAKPKARQKQAPKAAPKARKAPTTRKAASRPAVARKAPPTRRPAPRKVTAVTKNYPHLELGGTTERIGGWPDSLPIFLVGFVLALLGLFQWRGAVQAEAAAQAENQSSDASNPFALLANMQAPLKKLQEDIEGLNEQQVCDRVDEILNYYVLPFAEVRRGVIDRLGMELGAEVLVIIAYGERMLNRVWSAASDGHLPEAMSVLPDAVDSLAEAAGKVQAAGALPSVEEGSDDSGESDESDDSADDSTNNSAEGSEESSDNKDKA